MLIELIKKDIVFAKKWVLIAGALVGGLLVSVFVDGSNIILTAMLFYLVMGMLISKICQTEDSPEVKAFLRSLPISVSKIVMARYAILFALIVVLVAFLGISSYIQNLNLTDSGVTIMVIISAFCALYYSFYLFLFYHELRT